MSFSGIPSAKDPHALFEYSVRRVVSLGMMNDTNAHQVWANYIFRDEPKAFVRSDLMSIVKHEYSGYFSEDLHYMFLGEKIKSNFPEFFDIEEDLNLFERIEKALKEECKELKNPRNRKVYKVSSCVNISSQDDQFVYKAQLVVEEGDDPHFSEGMPVDFRIPDAFPYACEVVEYDYANALLFFSTTRQIHSTYDARIVSDATMNTIALMKLLQEISEHPIKETLPLHKFLNNTTKNLSKVSHGQYPGYLDDLLIEDSSQQKAFQAALSNDITFIWGPPGTGKSYTLASIIMALHKMKGERTAVCCLSNVAVDQLVNKVVDIIGEHEPEMSRGEFYRAGRTEDPKLTDTEFLFPDDSVARSLRIRIRLFSNKIETYKRDNLQFSDDAIKIKAKLKDAREQLKDHTDYLISHVKVVFSTIANFVINPRLKGGEFDNLIVDEASMLAMPQLIAMASKVTKRIILVGDFQQLSPITVAGVPMLKDSVFKLCGIDIKHTNHPALHQLLNQRRSNPKIVDIINHSFYADRLKAVNNKYNSIVARPPYSECVIGMFCVKDGAVRFTRGGTRQNVANADAVINIIDLYSKDEEETFTIGIITPYTGQVSLLKKLFGDKEYDLDFRERVKIGTVHTFQGSECDVIIFDMVDCSKFEKGKNVYPGKIYAGEQGEQLLNVAISRARHKLIIICDPEYMVAPPGGKISEKSMSIFNTLLKARWTQI